MVYVNRIQYGKNLVNRVNPQPSILIRYARIKMKVQRLEDCGHENSSKIR